MYDSRIGRWTSIDPARQFASPYVGMGNNPVNGVDPDGRLFGKWRAKRYANKHGGSYFQDNVTGKWWAEGSLSKGTGVWAKDFGKAGVGLNLKANFNYSVKFSTDFIGGVSDFGNIYFEMREANWKGSDKYFHSKANFKASVRGDGGRYAAEKMR